MNQNTNRITDDGETIKNLNKIIQVVGRINKKHSYRKCNPAIQKPDLTFETIQQKGILK